MPHKHSQRNGLVKELASYDLGMPGVQEPLGKKINCPKLRSTKFQGWSGKSEVSHSKSWNTLSHLILLVDELIFVSPLWMSSESQAISSPSTYFIYDLPPLTSPFPTPLWWWVLPLKPSSALPCLLCTWRRYWRTTCWLWGLLRRTPAATVAIGKWAKHDEWWFFNGNRMGKKREKKHGRNGLEVGKPRIWMLDIHRYTLW